MSSFLRLTPIASPSDVVVAMSPTIQEPVSIFGWNDNHNPSLDDTLSGSKQDTWIVLSPQLASRASSEGSEHSSQAETMSTVDDPIDDLNVSMESNDDMNTDSNAQASTLIPPPSLLDILGNSLLLHQIAPYLDVRSRLALASTSKSYKTCLHVAPETFRYTSLVNIKSACLNIKPIDPGGISWRAERMDEALTEDEFYGGPIRGIMYKLGRRNALQHVSTMILDGLTIPVDFVREIIAETKYNVRLLSIREAKHLSERKLMQVLKYSCRPTRAEGTPRLKGLYVFGPMDPSSRPAEPETGRRRSPTRYPDSPTSSVVTALGAQLGAEWNRKSQALLSSELSPKQDKWWQASGSMFKKEPMHEWAETLRACEGIVHFDATLCRGPQHSSAVSVGAESSVQAITWTPDTLATVALGSSGCAKCGTAPEGLIYFESCASPHLPLLAPPPLHSSSVREAQRPFTITDTQQAQRFIARCQNCLRGRWCERCQKWWCEACYEVPGRGSNSSTSSLTSLQQTEMFQAVTEAAGLLTTGATPISVAPAKDVKMGTKRDCWGCGWTCGDCRDLFIRPCKRCSNEYCILEEGYSPKDHCDWCRYSGRRTRELY